MPDKQSVRDDWDFYPCQVESATASVFLNLGYQDVAPITGADTVYWLDFEMLTPGEHGMGIDPDANTLWDIEDAVVTSLKEAPLYYVGRLRNHGKWSLYLYGPSGQENLLREAADRAIAEHGQRGYEIVSNPDADWADYTKFLYPNAERYQWIMDSRVIHALAKDGDQHHLPREVDHFLYFASEAERQAATDETASAGFVVKNQDDAASGERPYELHLVREDPVDLEHIHSVVMHLIGIAANHNGEYDGWGTSVINSEE